MLFQSAESRYNTWVRDHYRFLLRSAWALTGSRAIAEDVVQDCFANAWKHRTQLRDAALARAWLFQIMRRAAFRQAVPGMQSLDDEEQPEQAAPDAGLDDKLDVVKALARPAPIHREVLVLFYFDDMPTAQMADALLAWEMNGVPISLAHGGPLRLIVPGYTGVNNIKYIKRLAFTTKETDAKIMSHGYRLAPPGGKGDPSQPSVQEMTVKSWINSPAPDATDVKAGMVQVQGVAFGGLNGVKRVEVSLDGGKTWSEARLTGPDLGRYAWRQFVLAAKLPAGSHILASRATDTAGNVQPEQRMENAGGYNNTSWADHAVKVTVA